MHKNGKKEIPMAAERAVKPQRLICSLGSEQLPEELTPQTPFTTTSHQGTVEHGFPLRVQEKGFPSSVSWGPARHYFP